MTFLKGTVKGYWNADQLWINWNDVYSSFADDGNEYDDNDVDGDDDGDCDDDGDVMMTIMMVMLWWR